MSKNTVTPISDEEYMVNLLVDGKWPMVSTLLRGATVIPTSIVQAKLESGVLTEDKSRALYAFLMQYGLGANEAVQESIQATLRLLVTQYPGLQSSNGAFASPPPFKRAAPRGNDQSPPPFTKLAKALPAQDVSPAPFKTYEHPVAAPSQALLPESPVVIEPSPWAPIGSLYPVSNSFWAGIKLERSASASDATKIKPQKRMKASSSDPAVAAPLPNSKPSTPPIAIPKRRVVREERELISSSSSPDTPQHSPSGDEANGWGSYVATRQSDQPGKQ